MNFYLSLILLQMLFSASLCEKQINGGCKKKKIQGKPSLVCHRLEANLKQENNSLKIEKIFYQLDHGQILNQAFDFESILNINPNQMKFFNLKGIDLNASTGFKMTPLKKYDYFQNDSLMIYTGIEIDFIDSLLDLYINGTIMSDNQCSLLTPHVNDSISFFSTFSSWSTILVLSNIQYSRKLCPLLFRNVMLFDLYIIYMQNSFYRKNFIQFHDLGRQFDSNFTIESIQFSESHNINMNEKLLNKNLFKNLKEFIFEGTLDSIQTDLFGSLKFLRRIDIFILYLRKFLHKTGIKWMRQINLDLAVNLKDINEIRRYLNRTVDIYLLENAFIEEKKLKNLDKIFQRLSLFSNEDFCLYMNFPFKQLVIITSDFRYPKPTCTMLWIMQFFPKFVEIEPDKFAAYQNYFSFLKNQSYINDCNFSRKIELCNQTNFQSKLSTVNDWFQSFIFFDFVVLVLTPVICFLGLFFNLLIVMVVSKNSKSDLKTRQYMYMKINAVCNSIILTINLLSLINECQYPFGLFCSSIREVKAVQFYKVIMIEFVANSLKSISNFSYIAFSLNRLLLIEKDRMPYFKKFGKDFKKLIKYIILVITFSLMNGVVHVVQYDMRDSLETREFPSLFIKDMYYFTEPEANGLMKTHVKFKVVLTFKVICDFINNILFIVLNTLVDFVLLIKLKRLLDEKMINSKDQKLKEHIILKTSLMVILYALLNIIFKIPMIVLSFNDIVLIFRKDYLNYNGPMILSDIGSFNKSHLFKSVCVFDQYCTILERFFNLLVLLSLSINFFFYYCFDKRFKTCFRECFTKKDNEETHPFTLIDALSVFEQSSSSF